MAYWWVSQNRSYKHERAGGYLWAPLTDKGGQTPFHWKNMGLVRPGDLIFSYVGQHIVAVSAAQTNSYREPRPKELESQGSWDSIGQMVKVYYQDIPSPLSVKEIPDNLRDLMRHRYSPLDSEGTGNQGYLFGITDHAGMSILVRLQGVQADELAASAIAYAPIAETEKDALVRARVGQGRFRDDLLRMWEQGCAISGVQIPSLLRASHIKPWRFSNNQERLDPYNGLLLLAQYDAAFDAGLITFDLDGEIHVSPGVDADQLSKAGINIFARLRNIHPSHQRYLDYHRCNRLR